jgi:sugar transferase (PEP-CTERM/EpsH1 system associated)
MNILFVCHRLPFPPDHGGKIRAFHMIRHLGAKHSVTVASLAESQQEVDDGVGLKEYCAEVITEIIPRSVRWLRAWKALFSSCPSSVAYFHSPTLYERIQTRLLVNHFDCIIVHCAFVAEYVLRTNVRFRILDFCDLDSAKWSDYSQSKKFPLSLAYKLEASKLSNYERRVAGHFDHCAVATQGELEELSKLGAGVPCSIIPNGVDGQEFQSKSTDYDRRVIVFVGRMDYFPNIDAMLYFSKQIFPIIRRSVPYVQLRIVGSNPVAAIRSLASISGITVTGHVPDVRVCLDDAAVAVAPLRVARGTQNKILEAMAMGVPVVATPQAAKGINATPGRDLLVAGDEVIFARHVVSLIQNESARKKLADVGRRKVLETHRWSFSMNVLDGILEHRLTEQENSVEDHVSLSRITLMVNKV